MHIKVLVETLLCTSGIWVKAVKLLRVTVEFESNTMRAEAQVVFDINSTVVQKQVRQPSP